MENQKFIIPKHFGKAIRAQRQRERNRQSDMKHRAAMLEILRQRNEDKKILTQEEFNRKWQ
jgi:hypothetical protein